MAGPRIPVQSSLLTSVGYDPEAQELSVEFKNGKVYTYLDVPPHVHERLTKADSIGKAFATHVRNAGYTFTVDTPEASPEDAGGNPES